ncbi:MAG: glycoside hydrolase family 3 C-terminal domain-containing protein [Bacteroidales bacterium]|nr:glycoside hydrolase family 3 C-terminal domain-containing protein [Bacteroidales bacterium]
MKKYLFFVLLCVVACGRQSDTPVYLDPSADIEARVEDALSRMSLDEKIAAIHAQSTFSLPGVKKLGIPELWTSDGPHGVRPEVPWNDWGNPGWNNDSCVAFPALTCLAATWNRDVAGQYGAAIGEEARFREKDVILGPGVNMYRSPLCGRNFEYMGEDPYLAGKLAVPYIHGLQSKGVGACVKHYACNNEERHRHKTDVEVSERALREIYLPAFEMAVKEGGAWSMMASYNLFRGTHCCHNGYLINDILKGEWGFDGVVMSDWAGCHDTDEAVRGGLDVEFGTRVGKKMPAGESVYDTYYLAQPYKVGILAGKYDEEGLNDRVRRVLRLTFRTAMNMDKPFGSMCTQEHLDVARKVAQEGIVLLKNEGDVLPVRKPGKISVVGENAYKKMCIGGGSSMLKPIYEMSPLEGILERAAQEGMEVVYSRGYVGDTTTTQDGISSFQKLADDRPRAELIAEAVENSRDADYVIYVGGLNKSLYQDCENRDRLEYGLPYGQDELISELAKVNPNMTVVIISGNAVAMPWIDQVPSVLLGWYGGSEAGRAIADVLFGDVNPSGKLPFTFPVKLEDNPAHYNGKTFPTRGKNHYDEGIFLGYRWHEKMDIKPLFAFGHGLSYTDFEYGDVTLSSKKIRGGKITVKVPVTNVGQVAGSEVVQVYVHDCEASVEMPQKQLKGFDKVYLEPGQTKTVSIELGPDAFRFFDEESMDWKTEPGDFEILVGSASDNISRTVTVRL